MRSLLEPASNALRHTLGRVLVEASTQPPVVIVLDADGEITDMSAGGSQVLEDLRVSGPDGDFPGVVQIAAAKARFDGTSTNLTTRVRGRSGRWLRLHVTPMEASAGVVLTVETAHPDDLVKILLDSYGLTQRETDIVLRLCRGLPTKEIAKELAISAHTVRDHIKAIYQKAGVASRGELMAALFTNHVLDRLHRNVAHVAAS